MYLGAYLLYTSARWLVNGDRAVAIVHAHWIIHLERSTHLAIETQLQRALRFGAAGWLLSNIYLLAQLAVLPTALIWLYRRSRPIYRELRTTIIATWAISVPVFALFPVAPPRIAQPGILDSVSHEAALALTGHSTLFYNPYAAVPSLHVGFAFAISIASLATLKSLTARTLAVLWGPVVTISVIATGNHYVLDVGAGLLAVALGFGLARYVSRRGCEGRPCAGLEIADLRPGSTVTAPPGTQAG